MPQPFVYGIPCLAWCAGAKKPPGLPPGSGDLLAPWGGCVSARPPGAPAVCPPPPSPCGARSPDPAESGVSAGQGVCVGGRRGWDSAPLLMEGLGSKGRLRSQKAWNPGVGEPPLIRIPEGLTHDAFLLTAHTRPSSCRRWKERGIFGPGVEMVALSGQLSLTAV